MRKILNILEAALFPALFFIVCMTPVVAWHWPVGV